MKSGRVPTWMPRESSDGSQRKDYVTLEVEKALNSDLVVIPAPVSGAEMPSPADLPESVRPLAFRNAISLSNEHWRAGAQRIEAVIGPVGTALSQEVGTALAAIRFEVTMAGTSKTVWTRVRDQKIASFRRFGSHLYQLRPGVVDVEVARGRRRRALRLTLHQGDKATVAIDSEAFGRSIALSDVQSG